MDAFSLVIDHEQTRVTRDRLSCIITGKTQIDPITGRQFDGWSASGDTDAAGDLKCWAEPVTGKLMLRPVQLSRLWQTTATGIYARIKKANLTLTTASAWEDNEFNGQAAVSVALKDKSFSEEAITTATYDANRPFYVAPVFFSSGEDNRGYLDCGWGAANTGVAVRFYASGRYEIRKAGTLVAEGSWSGNTSGAPQKATGQRVGFLMFPIPPNELLVYTTWGGGFVHRFADLDPQDTLGEVTPASYFRFQCVEMGTDVELAPIRFNSSGYLDSIPCFFTTPPEAGAVVEQEFFRWVPGYGTWSHVTSLRNAANNGTFTPDGIETEFRFRATLTSDNDATGYFMGFTAAYPSVLGATPDEEQDITEYVTDLRLTAAMDPASPRVSAVLRSPTEINELVEDASRRILGTENRPFALRLGTLTVFDGIGDRPSWDDSVSDESQRVFVEIRNKWKLLEEYRFTEPEVFDGLTLEEAVELILGSAGIDVYEIGADASTIEVELSSRISERDFAVQAEPRDTAAELLKQLHEQFVPDWFMGIRPTADGDKFQLLSPAEMGDLPAVTIYPTVAQAVEELADPPTAFVYHEYRQESPPTEFTRLYVHGRDPREGRALVSVKQDTDREDPTKAVADRTDEWTGTPRKAALQVEYLRSQEAVDRTRDAMWRRAGFRRRIGEWECEMLINPETGYPVWIGECVELAGLGVFRIQSMDIPLTTEPNSETDTGRRRARYMGEMLMAERDDSMGLGHARQHETSLPQLILGWKKVREESRPFETRPPASVEL